MTKTRTPAPAVLAPELQAAPLTEPSSESVTVRDVYAAQTLSAIVCGIVQRGGVAALQAALAENTLIEHVFYIADTAMQARDA